MSLTKIVAGLLACSIGSAIVAHFIEGGASFTDSAAMLRDRSIHAATALAKLMGLTPRTSEDIAHELREMLPSVEKLASQGRPCRPTLILQLEGACLETPYDPKFGFGVVLRPGFVELLTAAGNCGFEILLWSNRPTEAAESLFTTRVLPAVLQADRFRFMAFEKHMQNSLQQENIAKAEAAAAQGVQLPRSKSMYFPHEIESEYITKLLRIHGILGREFAPVSEEVVLGTQGTTLTATVANKDLRLLPRSLDDLLLVDVNTRNKAAYPAHTLLVTTIEGKGNFVEGDPTLHLIAELLTYYAALRHNPEYASTTNTIAEFTAFLRAKAAQMSLLPATDSPLDDTVGIFGLMARLAEEEAREKKQR